MMVFSESPLLLKFYEQFMQLDINLMRHWARLTGQMKKELDRFFSMVRHTHCSSSACPSRSARHRNEKRVGTNRISWEREVQLH